MPSDRRTVWALVALAVVVAIGAWTWFGPGASSPTAPATATPRQGAAGGAAPLPKPEAMTVKLAALEGERAEPTDARRNPFQFGARAEEAATPTVEAQPEAFGAPATPPPPSGPPPPPPIALKFIGTVEKADGVKLAVLTDGRAPLYGEEGDIIDGRYRILSIGTESIDIAYADGRGRQTIRLSGQ